jgi:Flp pilus assembly protein TadB
MTMSTSRFSQAPGATGEPLRFTSVSARDRGTAPRCLCDRLKRRTRSVSTGQAEKTLAGQSPRQWHLRAFARLITGVLLAFAIAWWMPPLL